MDNVIFEWLLGVIAVPLITWIKKALKIEGEGAMLLTFVSTVVLAFLYLFLNGELAGTDFNDISGLIAKVLAAATVVYKLLLPLLEKAYAKLAGE